MKTTVDIPDAELRDAMKFVKAATKREAIVLAIREFNQRRRVAALARHAGSGPGMMSTADLARLRRRP